MSPDDPSAPLLDALDAARSLACAGDGLIVVLLRRCDVAAALHWQVGSADANLKVDHVAAALGTDHAVLIVVGSAEVAGRITRVSDITQSQLSSAGVFVVAHVHVVRLGSRAVAWHDLTDSAQGGVLWPVGSQRTWGGAGDRLAVDGCTLRQEDEEQLASDYLVQERSTPLFGQQPRVLPPGGVIGE